jgi:hypothetical protein
MSRKHNPLGPGGTWKTGQRVPRDGDYENQYGQLVRFDAGTTFPPRVGRKSGGEVAYWTIRPAA